MEDKYHITYDSEKEKAFIVHMPDKEVKFKWSHNRLYYCTVDYSIQDNKVIPKRVKKVTFKQIWSRWSMKINLFIQTDK